jgi:hypothetical protein
MVAVQINPQLDVDAVSDKTGSRNLIMVPVVLPHGTCRALSRHQRSGGVLFGAVFGLVLLFTDILEWRSLAGSSGDVTATTIIILASAAITFAPLVVASAVFLISSSTPAGGAEP